MFFSLESSQCIVPKLRPVSKHHYISSLDICKLRSCLNENLSFFKLFIFFVKGKDVKIFCTYICLLISLKKSNIKMNPHTITIVIFFHKDTNEKNFFRRNMDPAKISKLAQLEMCRG